MDVLDFNICGFQSLLKECGVRYITNNLLEQTDTIFPANCGIYNRDGLYIMGNRFMGFKSGKNTVLWFFTAGAASLFHINDKKKSNYLRETIKDVLSITAVLQFLVGVYSFSFAVELVLVPFVFLIGGWL